MALKVIKLLFFGFLLSLTITTQHYCTFAAKHNFESKITNLNDYLQIFKDCLIHLVNFQGIDFEPLIQPVLLSWHSVTLKVPTLDKVRKDRFYGIISTRLQELDYNNVIQHKVTCQTFVYIFPPPSGEVFNYLSFQPQGLLIPTHLYSFQPGASDFHDLNFRYSISNLVISRGIYQVLVKKICDTSFMWNLAMSKFELRYPITKIFELETQNSRREGNKIIKFGIGSKAALSNVRRFIQISLNNLSLNDFKSMETDLDRNWIVDSRSKLFLKWPRTSSKAYNLVIESWNSFFRSKGQSVGFRSFKNLKAKIGLEVDQINFAILVPNLTFVSSTEAYLSPCKSLLFTSNAADGSVENFTACNAGLTPPNVNFVQESSLAFLKNFELFYFIACGRVDNVELSFKGFITAFDSWTWILIIVTYTLIRLLMYPSYKKNLCFSIAYCIIDSPKILLEQGDSRITDLIIVKNFSWTFGSAILIGIVLSNAFKGKNISALTAPLRPIPFQTFDQLVSANYRILSPVQEGMKRTIFNYPDIADYIEKFTEFGRAFSNMTVKTGNLSELQKHIKHYPKEVESILEGRFNFSYLEVMNECNNTGVASWTSDLKPMELKLRLLKQSRSRHEYVSMGREALLEKINGWSIEKWADPEIFRRLSRIFESGIFNQWEVVESFVESLDYKVAKIFDGGSEDYRPLKLHGNIVAIFVILGVGLGISFGVFLVEILCLLLVEIFFLFSYK